MSVKFFGQYLLEKKLITPKDLLNAIDLQEQTNLRFGDLVISLGLMTSAQTEEVHRAQRLKDLQFGEMAVTMGYLTHEQVKHLLHQQRSNHLFIGQALVKIGALPEDQMEKALSDFNVEQSSYLTEKITILPDIPCPPVWEIVADQTCKMLTRLAGLPNRTGQCVSTDKLPEKPVVVEMGFSGTVSARFLVTLSDSGRKMIAQAILKENSQDPDLGQNLDDSLLAFINLTCGNIASKATQLGYDIDITPAQFKPTSAATETEADKNLMGMIIPVYLSDGEVFEMTIFVAKDKPC